VNGAGPARRSPRRVLAGAFAGSLVALVVARGGARAEQRDPSCFTVPLIAHEGVAVQRLPRGFLRAGSDSLWSRDGGWMRGRDYRIDRLTGDVRLLRFLAPGDTVWARACGLLAPPPLEYTRQVYRPARSAQAANDTGPRPTPLLPAVRPATTRDPGTSPSGTSLGVSGNKTIAVDFGSAQDAALRQSLDLSIGGQVAPGVELTGVLSDRDTPLSAEGSSQDLRSLDRVLVELRAKDGRGSLGDIPLQVARGEFARLERRVQGVSGEWAPGALRVRAAAAGAQGEYFRLQFQGVDGRQGPYILTDRDGGQGITIVAGSEVVTVDGVRMVRGEAADYAIDEERARITFSNRRPISSASRITVEYQYSLVRFRRNLALASSEWTRGGWSWFAHGLREGDDAGRPVGGALDPNDRLALAQAGDSLALGAGVTPGVGDYDSVRVGGTLRYAFAGLDSGAFVVRFARVGDGRGDYADSALVGGRTIFRFAGQGLGAYRIGRLLPAPETHELGAVGTRLQAGAVKLEAEGAFSRLDRNTLSSRDASDDAGGAGQVALSSEGHLPFLAGKVGALAAYRAVEKRFAPFTRLERPFAEEDWGLPAGSDLEHQRRAEAQAWWRPDDSRELRADLARLTTPEGYAGLRRQVSGRFAAGSLAAQGGWLDTEGERAGLAFPNGGRTRGTGELRWRGSWWAPGVRAETDTRETPGDTATVRDRVRMLDADVGTGARFPWRATLGAGARTDRRDAGRTVAQSRTKVLRAELETPATAPFGVAFVANRRDTRDETSGALVRQDLASSRLRAEWRPAGLSGSLQVERTGEAENRRVRALTFVGAGRGAYDATGNFVGTGDYDLVLVVSPELERFARTATSARAAWTFGQSSESWRGSRVEFTLEDEARRRGGGRLADVFVSTGAALVDPDLSRGSIVQRLEAELAPGSRAAGMKLRAERRVNADRTFENFAQTTDQRTGSLRWRTRPTLTTSTEAEARVQWQRAEQSLAGGARYGRTLVDQVGSAQWVWQPRAQLRLAAAMDATWSRALSSTEATRTLRVGPDAAIGVGKSGRAELIVRRAFVSGPPAVGLLPSAEAAGAARWDGTARFDLRLHETTTFGLESSVRERPGRKTVVTGRAEVRAFF
jgi:hypothetical protein